MIHSISPIQATDSPGFVTFTPPTQARVDRQPSYQLDRMLFDGINIDAQRGYVRMASVFDPVRSMSGL